MVENNFKITLPNYVIDLPNLLEKLNYELNENIDWSETLKEIYNTENKRFLNRFSIELNILQQYSIVPPPTLKSLKSNFKLLIPSILLSLPNEEVSFLNDKINCLKLEFCFFVFLFFLDKFCDFCDYFGDFLDFLDFLIHFYSEI